MIREIAINDNWLVKSGFDPKCLESDFDWGASFPIDLPHNNIALDENYFDAFDTQKEMTYSRVLVVSEKNNGKKMALRFGGILSYVEVYVNGIFVTSHKGDAPFDADITFPIKFNYDNRITLKVDSRLRKEVPCCGVRGPEITYGGIHRNVSFLVMDGRDIARAKVSTPTVSAASSLVKIDVTLYDFYPDTCVSAVVVAADGSRSGILSTKTVLASTVSLEGYIEGVELWTCASPTLYTAKITLSQDEKILDIKTIYFGFRTAEFRRDGFYLNGILTKLIGLNRVDSYPILGKAMPRDEQECDARLLKKLACNVTRTLGLASPAFLDECSRIGVMVIEDIAGDGYLGKGEWRDSLISSVCDMVTRDYNEACIIAWGVRVNNSSDCDELYFKTSKAAKSIDDRATLGARNFMGSHMYEDVFAFNEYGKKLTKRAKTSNLFVPYLISEHTGEIAPATNYDCESIRLEQALRHLKVMDACIASPKICGAIGMSLSDFNSFRQGGNGDSVNHYGVTDAYRNLKLSGWAYASQADGEPIMELSSNLSRDDFVGKLFIFTNCDSVKLYRNDCLVSENFPSGEFPSLRHAPIIISDFIGNLPEAEGISGLKLKLFSSLTARAQAHGLNCVNFINRVKLWLLKKLLHKSSAAIMKLVDEYSLYPPLGVTYRFEGISGGEVKLTRIITNKIKRTLRVEYDKNTLDSSSEVAVIKFSVFAEDGVGNILTYDFSPVRLSSAGSVAIVGKNTISLKGGMGAFYVRAVGAGAGSVKIATEFGLKTIELSVIAPNKEEI